MDKFIWLTPVYWDSVTNTHLDGKYKIAINVRYIRQFVYTDYDYSLLTITDAPLGSDSFHKFRESAGEIMHLIRSSQNE